MQEVLLRNSIEILQCLQMELQGQVEESVIERLDEAVNNLVELRGNSQVDAESALRILVLLADILAKIPSVASAVGALIQGVCDAASH